MIPGGTFTQLYDPERREGATQQAYDIAARAPAGSKTFLMKGGGRAHQPTEEELRYRAGEISRATGRNYDEVFEVIKRTGGTFSGSGADQPDPSTVQRPASSSAVMPNFQRQRRFPGGGNFDVGGGVFNI